jgi:hypothetical protein
MYIGGTCYMQSYIWFDNRCVLMHVQYAATCTPQSQQLRLTMLRLERKVCSENVGQLKSPIMSQLMVCLRIAEVLVTWLNIYILLIA